MSRLASAHSVLRFGVFELDLQTGELRKSGVLLHLPPQPFKVLALLVNRPGQLVTREELREQIWGTDTFVDFEHGLNFAIKKIRDTLGDDPETPRYIETLPRRGYRFIAPVEGIPTTSEAQIREVSSLQQTTSAPEAPRKSTRFRWAAISGATILVVGLAVAGWLFYSRKAHVLTEKDTIVVADFINTTGDPVFDGALRQGLSVQLEQTPYLRLVSGDQIAQTLRLMEKPPDTRLTHDVAREVCQRANATIVVEGSVAALSSQYVIGLDAINCPTGDIIAQEQVTANGKEQVLEALGNATFKLRSKLGESSVSLETYDLPLAQVTTSSLEALQAFTLGRQALNNNDYQTAISLVQRAVGLDPDFAEAYAFLGRVYTHEGQLGMGAENATKAYTLRDRVSEREKFYITADYQLRATGDMDKAVQICEQWAKTFPRDPQALESLWNSYWGAGRFEESLDAIHELHRLDPTPQTYFLLALGYVRLGRINEALTTIRQGEANHVDPAVFRSILYGIAFIQNDSAAMDRQLTGPWMVPLGSDGAQAVTAAYNGQLVRARELGEHAVAWARQHDAKNLLVSLEVGGALIEALVGNFPKARRAVEAAAEFPEDRDLEGAAAMVWALVGDAALAQKLADDLSKRFPNATYIRYGALPAIQGLLALHHGRPDEAMKALGALSSHELVPP